MTKIIFQSYSSIFHTTLPHPLFLASGPNREQSPVARDMSTWSTYEPLNQTLSPASQDLGQASQDLGPASLDLGPASQA